VQQHREIEDGEPLDERERDPDQRLLETDESPRREAEDRELADADREVPDGLFLVEIAHLRARDRSAQLGPERSRVLRV